MESFKKQKSLQRSMADKKFNKKDIKEKVDEGYIHVNILFEIVGQPKDHVSKAMKLFLENIDKEEHIIKVSEDFEEVIELGDGMFSMAAEMEYLILGIEKLTWFAFNFMPASIEIIAPEELTFAEKDLSNWMNDLLAKLHEVNMNHTNLKGSHKDLVKNLNATIRNSILLAIEQGPLTLKETSKKIGIGPENTQKFLDAMIKEEKLVLDGKKYKRK